MVTLKKKKIATMYFGKIPRDWKVVKVDEITLFHKQGYYTNEKYTTSGQYILLRATDMQNPYIHIDTAPRINVSKKDFESYKVEKGDILIVRSGSIGRYGIVEEDKKAIFGSYLIKFKLNQKNVSNKYFGYLYNSDFTFRQLKRIQQGSSNININAENIKAIYLPLPSLEEQEQIATVLSDMDDLIESLEKIIEKKKKIKQGTMQQLLTGEKRLPGFNDSWVEDKLGNLSFIKTGSKNNQDQTGDGKYPFFVRSQEVARIDTYSYDCEAVLVPGEGGIGEIFHYVNGKFDAHQRVYVINEFNEISGKYIYYYLKQNFLDHAMKYTVKATVDSLRLPTFQDFMIIYPANKNEQKEIVKVLSDMDAEIEALEEKLEKYKRLKEGMMQELLTGRIRLV